MCVAIFSSPTSSSLFFFVFFFGCCRRRCRWVVLFVGLLRRRTSGSFSHSLSLSAVPVGRQRPSAATTRLHATAITRSTTPRWLWETKNASQHKWKHTEWAPFPSRKLFVCVCVSVCVGFPLAVGREKKTDSFVLSRIGNNGDVVMGHAHTRATLGRDPPVDRGEREREREP